MEPIQNLPTCTICLEQLNGKYSVDAWGNPFHSRHEHEGIFCHSCSRIISQKITQGGYQYPDGYYLCSLCQASVVEEDSGISVAYQSVLSQFTAKGFNRLPENIPIKLVNLTQLKEKSGNLAHAKLKGVTKTKLAANRSSRPSSLYQIFLLKGLPRIEFEAVLAHELLHVWVYENSITLPPEKIEGFCNLGSALIYENDGTYFSDIHLQAMANDPDPFYGVGYRRLKDRLNNIGWDNLIQTLLNSNN